MRDIVFVAVALAFFGLSYLYVLGCDRIIGRDAAPHRPPLASPTATRLSTDQTTAAVRS